MNCVHPSRNENPSPSVTVDRRLVRRPAEWAQCFALLLAFLVPFGASAQPVPPVPEPTPVTSTNALTQAAVRTGILACAGRINQVTNFLGGATGAALYTPPGQPDQRLATLSMEVKNGATTSYVSASFAPNQANGCGAAYDAVTWWPDSCEAVVSRHFGAFKKVGKLQRDITMLEGGPATNVFLMPAGNGCVSIKKEVVL